MNTSELRKLGSENKPKIGEKFINEHDGKVYVHLENFGDVSTCEQCNFCDTPRRMQSNHPNLRPLRILQASLSSRHHLGEEWIENSGSIPVPLGTLVDVEYRDGNTCHALPAGKWLNGAWCAHDWGIDGSTGDIIKWRIHIHGLPK